jgi:formylglycine-generating enzyme required for sulfatase activity
MGLLGHDEILKLHAAAVSAHLIESRQAMLTGIEASLTGGIPRAANPSDQILQDLDALNAVGALVDGSVPLATWLSNAVARTGTRKESAIFVAALARCTGQQPGEKGAHQGSAASAEAGAPPNPKAIRALRVAPALALIFVSTTATVAYQALFPDAKKAREPLDMDASTSNPLATEPEPKPPDGMLSLRGARFALGSGEVEIREALAMCHPNSIFTCEAEQFERERPRHEVQVSRFFMDVHEVTNAQFAQWMNSAPDLAPDADGVVTRTGARILWIRHQLSGIRRGRSGWEASLGAEDKPVVLVSWTGAQHYCRARGARLPTEAEWDLAARGMERRTFAWGADPPRCADAIFGRYPKEPCQSEPPGPVSVFSADRDRTPEGLRGLGGNVREWVLDAFERYHACSPSCDNPGLEESDNYARERGIRGCGWADPPHFCRAAQRSHDGESAVDPSVGFRCALSAVAPGREAGTE